MRVGKHRRLLIFLMFGGMAAAMLIGFGLVRLLSDRADVADDLLRERSFVAAWSAGALADELDRCRRALASGRETARAVGCAGVGEGSSPFVWFVAEDPVRRRDGPLDETEMERLRLEFGRGCVPGAEGVPACLELARRMADADRWADPLVARYGLPVVQALERYAPREDASRRLRHRLERILFEDSVRRHHNQLLVLMRPHDENPEDGPRWVQLGRYRLTGLPGGGGLIGFDSRPGHEQVRAFLASRNLLQGDGLDFGIRVTPEPARLDARHASTAFIDERVGFLVVDDPRFEQRLGEARRGTNLLIGWFSLAGLVLLGSLALAWRAARGAIENVQMRENFVASVSHEFRSPLGGLALMIETLLEGKIGSDSRKREYLEQMQRETRRLTRLSENLLALGRIRRAGEAGGQAWKPARVLDAAVEQVRAEADVKNVEMAVSIEGDLPEGAGDADLVQMALLNLLDNAVKFSPEQSRVDVSASVDDGAVRFTVEDRGPGLPPAERDKIFDWFYRPGRELERKTRGTGLGLAIVRAVADRHGGRVKVSDRSGGGARFDLWIPRKDPEAGEGAHGG